MRNKKFIAAAGIAALALTAATALAQSRNDNRRFQDDRYYNVCDSGAPRAQIQCAQRELANSDRRLNVAYSRMIADAQRSDRADRARRYPGWYSQEVALRNAERAWIAMRDSDCKFVTQPDIGRRRQVALSYTLCQADRTNSRADQLDDMRNQLSQSYS